MHPLADQALQIAAEHHQAGRLAEAETIYREVLARTPNHFHALHMMGVLAGQAGRHEAALKLLNRAVASAPDDAAARCNLGAALLGMNRVDEAEVALGEAIRLNPAMAAAYDNLGRRHTACGRIDLAVASYRKAAALAPDSPALQSNLAWTVSLHPDYDGQSLLTEARRWDERHGRPFREFIRPHPNDPAPERRLKVGFVSPDFRRHVVGDNLLPFLRHYDRDAFEIHCYSSVTAPDARTREIRDLANEWHEIRAVTDDVADAMIRADGIDILVDLALHMAGNRMPIFARKPAPVQACYLGYCGTTGLETVDYRLSDWFIDPADVDVTCYSEETIRLSHCYWCYEPQGSFPEISPLPAAESGHVTFGCFNHFGKASSPALESWAEILRGAPEARLSLHVPEGSCRDVVRDRFARGGVRPDRIAFVSRRDWGRYLDSLQAIDVALDPFPYGGGITTCDALWMGVPVVSLSGRTAVGRGGRSILSNIGLSELVAETPRDYVRVALGLAGDLPRLAALRAGLRSRMEASPLRDAKGFARDIAEAFRKMWRNWCVERRRT